MVGIEGAAMSGMLNVLANKLAPLVIKQYSSIVGVTKDLQNLQDLVEEINHWLEKTGYRAMDSSQLFNWLRQLKHVVYDIDDIVDEFHLEAEKHESHGGNHIMSKWLIAKPKSFLFQCKAAHKIKAVKERFAAIVKQRADFSAIVNSVPHGLPVSHINRTARAIPTLPIVDEALVHGRDQEKHEIISKLVDDNNRQIIKIVSIIGHGGCGKTTLAKIVFNDGNIVKGHFEVRIWVHVSQEFDVEKLLEKLFEAISGEKSGHYPLQQMTKTISDKLSGKRYLLVLDDVWTEDRIQWEEFIVHIKSGAPGSRILLTTRSRKVAEVVESTDPFNLLVLSDVDSWAVFSQSFGMSIKGLDSEFLEVGREIVNKCGGVPLAIKVLAGVLRDQGLLEEWKAMRDSNLLHVEEKEHRVLACLELSYFHLPSHLKQCFTMCSLFPKGNRICKKQLIDQWIAHDMIRLTPGVHYLEDIGDKHFQSLVQVSFLQDVDKFNGRVTCKMHDLVHDLARSILHDEFSTNVPDDATSSTKCYRYFSLNERPRKLLPENVFNNAHAIYVDKGNDITFGKALKNAKHVRSIIMNHILSTTVLTAIFQIKNLKYLEMLGLTCEALPEAITDIWSLQAVHLAYSDLLELPKSIGKLQKLRTLNLSHCGKLKCLPDSIGDCNMLLSLDLFKCEEITGLPNSIGRNEKLRVLRLGYTKLEKLPSSINTLSNLECFDLRNCWELAELPKGINNLHKLQILNLKSCTRLVELPEGIGNLQKLQVLNLKYCRKLGGMPIGIGQLSQLQKLGLFVVGEGEKFARISQLANVSRIGEELIIIGIEHVMEPDDAHKACLKLKSNLQRLNLEWKRCHVGEMNTELEQAVLDGLEPPPRIKKLEIHGYSGRQYACWMQNQVDVGVQKLAHFPLLRVMRLYDFPNLKHLHGLVELPFLEKLQLERMPSLESISGGPFPSLVKLIMNCLPSLGDVCILAQRTISDADEGGCCNNSTPDLGQVRVGNCVTYLIIIDCPKLKVKPYLPLSLQHLRLSRSSEQLMQSPDPCEGCSLSSGFSHLNKLELWGMTGSLGSAHGWELLKHMTALEKLNIRFSEALTNLPDCLGSLTSLQSLSVSNCSAIHMMPECLGELRSLHELSIKSCEKLSSLPESMGQLASLQELHIGWCNSLHQLPECLGELCSLRILYIGDLPSINKIPQSLKHLTSLQDLTIVRCNALHELPECLGDLRSLCKINIGWLPGLTCLPESMCGLTSLQTLYITNCPGIKSLPEGIKSLTSLKRLDIRGCPGIESLPEGLRLSPAEVEHAYDCGGVIYAL